MGCYLFNNRQRDHKKLFGNDAVFDLDWPAQENDWNRIAFGEAGRLLRWADKPKSDLVIDLYKLTGWRRTTNPQTGGEVRIVQGTYVGSETLSHQDALRMHPTIFNTAGNLKQLSVL
jgi:hypothetical protein